MLLWQPIEFWSEQNKIFEQEKLRKGYIEETIVNKATQFSMRVVERGPVTIKARVQKHFPSAETVSPAEVISKEKTRRTQMLHMKVMKELMMVFSKKSREEAAIKKNNRDKG